MKAKFLLYALGIVCMSLVSGTLMAQVGANESVSSTYNASNTEEANAQRIANLESQVKDAMAEVKRKKREAKTAQANAREAKAALKAEKQAQKARKDANAQARKAEKLLE